MTNDDEIPTADPATRRAALLHDLRTRLGPLCSDWPPQLFTAMIEGLADITLRDAARSGISTYDRRTTDRLIADMKEALQRSEESRHGGKE